MDIKTGDFLFCSGNYLTSKLIKHFTDSEWSHVALVINAEAIDRVLVLESVETSGVRIAPLSLYDSYDGKVVTARCPLVTEDKIKHLLTSGVDQLTKPYDNLEIAEISARIALGLFRHKDNNAFICSELVEYCLGQTEIEVPTNGGGFCYPKHIFELPGMQIIETLKEN